VIVTSGIAIQFGVTLIAGKPAYTCCNGAGRP